jgi:CpeT protein
MIDQFCEYFEGTFHNKHQAFSHPTKFAMIELLHIPYGKHKFRCTQRYYADKREYRNTIISVYEQDSKILVKNFKEENTETGELTYLSGCDILFEKIGEEFRGKNLCKTCFVSWSGKETYLQTQSVLGNGYYHVIDKGYDINTDEHIWGSFNGNFQFVKSPL